MSKYYDIKIDYDKLRKAIDDFGLDLIKMDLLEEFSQKRVIKIISTYRSKRNLHPNLLDE